MPKARSIRDARYNAKATKHYSFKLHNRTDAALIERLEAVGNVNGYIRRLIREDIERNPIPEAKNEREPSEEE